MRTAVLSLLVLSTVALGAGSKDEAQIRETFLSYRKALQKKDGRAAAAQVDRATLAYYGDLKDLALAADRGTLKARPIGDRFLALKLRWEVEPAKLAGLDPQQVVILVMEKGWVGAEIGAIELGELQIDGGRAEGEMLLRQSGPAPQPVSKAPVRLAFTREPQGWRMNLLPLVDYGNRMFTQTVQRLGMPEDQFIEEVLEQSAQKPVPATLWEPPRKAPAPAKK